MALASLDADYNFDNTIRTTSSLGYCDALLVASPPNCNDNMVIPVVGYSEAAAIPISGVSRGKVEIVGLAGVTCIAQNAVVDALAYVRNKVSVLKHFMGMPKIDMMYCCLLNAEGREVPNGGGGGGGGVDIILRVDVSYSSTFLSLSMVVAIMSMMWRRPSLTGVSMLGGFDSHGRLCGVSKLDHYYFHHAVANDMNVLLR